MRWPVVIGGAATAALCQARRPLGLPRALSVPLAASLPAFAAASAPPSRGRHAATWAAHMLAYKMVYEAPFDRPKRLKKRMHDVYPARIDNWLGRGTAPGVRLQRALRRPPRIGPLDKAMTALYGSWMAEPHLALAWLLWRHPERFPAAATRMAATFDLTVLCYWLFPTAPPWWHGQRRRRPGRNMRRVAVEAKRSHSGRKLRPAFRRQHIEGANPAGSTPSDHFDTSTMAAIVLAEANPVAGTLGAAYAAALAFAIVYLGEHYVTDVLAGGAVVGLVQAGAPTVAPLARRARAAFARLEPAVEPPAATARPAAARP